jgi:hypothetical protein
MALSRSEPSEEFEVGGDTEMVSLARRRRVAVNQGLFEEVNERIEKGSVRLLFAAAISFVCECTRLDCAERVPLTLAEYGASVRFQAIFSSSRVTLAKPSSVSSSARASATRLSTWSRTMAGHRRSSNPDATSRPRERPVLSQARSGAGLGSTC